MYIYIYIHIYIYIVYIVFVRIHIFIYQGSNWWGRWGVPLQLPENLTKFPFSPRLTPLPPPPTPPPRIFFHVYKWFSKTLFDSGAPSFHVVPPDSCHYMLLLLYPHTTHFPISSQVLEWMGQMDVLEILPARWDLKEETGNRIYIR